MSDSVTNGESNDAKNSCDHIQDAKSRVDISLPISKLPVELLCKIFHMNRPCTSSPLDMFPFMSTKEHFQRTLGWVAVSWVCRSWRSIALNDSTLWVVLPLTFPKWTTVMLERSQNAGLIVRLHRSSCSSRCRKIILPPILANASRVAELMLCTEKTDDIPKLLAHFSSTPKLSILQITTGGFINSSPPAIDLSNNIFRDTNRLCYLDLDGLNINWDSHLFSNPLHTLVLANISASARPSVAEFRSIFEKLSSTLKVLRLYRALLPNPSTSVDQNTDLAMLGSTPIPLPLLECIELDAEPGQLLSFFNNIFPGDQMREFQIMTAFNNQSGPAFLGFVKALNRHQFLAQFLSIVQDLSLGSFTRQFINFSAYNPSRSMRQLSSAPGISTKNLSFNFNLDICLHQMTGPQKAETAPSIIETVFRRLHWTNLCVLGISFDWGNETPPHLDRVLRSTFGTLTTLQTLTLSGVMPTRYGIKALRAESGATFAHTGSTAPIPFPGLKEILIRDGSFLPSCKRTAKITHLRRAVRGRFKLGIPIVKITLTSSLGLAKRDVECLGRYVADIDWDGYSGFEDDDDDDDDNDIDDSEEEDDDSEEDDDE